MHVGKVHCLTIKLSITAIIYAFIQNNTLEKQTHILLFIFTVILFVCKLVHPTCSIFKTCLDILPDYIKLCNSISIFTCILYKLITNKLYKTCYCHCSHCIKHLYFHSTHFRECYLTYLPFLIHTCSVVLAAGVFCAITPDRKCGSYNSSNDFISSSVSFKSTADAAPST